MSAKGKVKWEDDIAFTTTVRGRTVRVEGVETGRAHWRVGGSLFTEASGYSSDIAEAKRMAILVAEALPEVTS